MNKLVIILYLVAIMQASAAVAQNESTTEADSLRNIAAAYYEQQDYRKSSEYSRRAMEICKKTGDREGVARNAFSAGVCDEKAGMYYEALENYLVALTYFKELDNFQMAVRIYNVIGNAYAFLGDHVSELRWAEDALKLAQETGNTLYEAIFNVTCADASRYLQDTAQSVAYYDRALEISRGMDNKIHIARTLNNKAILFSPTSAEKLELLLEAAQLCEETTPKDAETFRLLSHIYVNIGDWYLKASRNDSAAVYFDRGVQTVREAGDKRLMIFMFSHLAENYYESGDFSKAKQFAQETVEIIHASAGSNHTFDVALKTLSKIYAREGDYRHSYETLLQWSAVNDSIQAKNAREEMSKINSRFVFENHRQAQMDARMRTIERTRKAFISALAISLLIVAGWIFHSRRMMRKNRSLYRQIREQTRLAEELENERKANRKLQMFEKPNRDEFPEKEADDSLHARLNILMEEQSLYTDREIKQKDIADKLGISERALHDCIKSDTGMGFSDYVNYMRLSHTCRLLLSPATEQLTIEAIAQNAGFKSRATFYRLFRERYGLTPVEFQKITYEQ